MEKDYNVSSDIEKKKFIETYQNKIFKPDNTLRVCFTKDHLDAIVLEHTLIKFFKTEGQCKYNFQTQKDVMFRILSNEVEMKKIKISLQYIFRFRCLDC